VDSLFANIKSRTYKSAPKRKAPAGGRLCLLTYPSVVIVTMVYQKAAGIEVKVVPSTFFSA